MGKNEDWINILVMYEYQLLISIYPSSHSYTISVWYSPSCGVCSDAAIKCGQSLR